MSPSSPLLLPAPCRWAVRRVPAGTRSGGDSGGRARLASGVPAAGTAARWRGGAEPSRTQPNPAEPIRAVPSRAERCRAEPSGAEPSRAVPSRSDPFPRRPVRAAGRRRSCPAARPSVRPSVRPSSRPPLKPSPPCGSDESSSSRRSSAMEDDLFQLRQLPVVKFRRTGESSRSDEDVISGEHEIQIEGVRTELEPVELEDGAAVPKEFANPTDDTFMVEDAVEAIGFGKFQWKLSVITGLAWMADAMEMMILSILAPQLHCGVCGNDVQFYPLGKHFRPVREKNRPKDQCVMDTVLWDPQWFCTSLHLDLGAEGPGGLWDWRSTPVVFWAIGTVFEVLLAVLVMPTLGWRWLLILSALPLLLFAVLCFWLPESARYDVLSGNQEKAIATLKRIATENGAPMPLGKLIISRQEDRGKMRDLFTPHFRWTTLLLWFIWFSNAFSYYGLVLLTTEFFQAGDVCSISSRREEVKAKCSLTCEYLTEEDYTDLLWTTLSEFPGVLVTLWIIDRIGRKKTMALSFLVFSFCSLLLFLCVGRNVLTVLLFIARAFISGGFQAAYVYTPEVYPTATRALGLGTCSGMARVGALITPFIAQVMLESSVYLTLVVYSSCCLLAAVASCFLPIETKGRGLQESSHREWGQEMVGRGSHSPGVTRSNSGSQE